MLSWWYRKSKIFDNVVPHGLSFVVGSLNHVFRLKQIAVHLLLGELLYQEYTSSVESAENEWIRFYLSAIHKQLLITSKLYYDKGEYYHWTSKGVIIKFRSYLCIHSSPPLCDVECHWCKMRMMRVEGSWLSHWLFHSRMVLHISHLLA